jgi:HK97 family phage portal protein
MSLTSRAASALVERRGADPNLEWGSSAPPPPGSSGGSVGGMAVTSESATQIAAVYGCCALLADSVASLPLRALDAPAHLVTSNELPKLPTLLENPYELIEPTDWIVGSIWSLALRGDYFGQIIERDRLAYPTQIMPLSPDIVRPEVRTGGEVNWFVAGKKIRTEDLFHIRYQSLPGHLLGISPIQAMRYPFGIAHVTDVHAANVFANSGDPRGVIQVKGQLSPAATKQMAADWMSAHQGPAKSSLPAVLTEDAIFNPITISPADQQLLESRKYSAEEISGLVFRIPPHYLGLNERSTSFGRGIEQQERSFVAGTLSGYLCRLERALTTCLPPGNFASFDISQRIRGSALERAQTGAFGTQGGFFTANEVRGRFFDLPPHENGDELLTPINTELLAKQLEELKQLKESPAAEQQPDPSENGHGDPAAVALK